jgi:hypothetical protein
MNSQAADGGGVFAWSFTSSPSSKRAPARTRAPRRGALTARQRACAASMSLNAMASPAAREPGAGRTPRPGHGSQLTIGHPASASLTHATWPGCRRRQLAEPRRVASGQPHHPLLVTGQAVLVRAILRHRSQSDTRRDQADRPALRTVWTGTRGSGGACAAGAVGPAERACPGTGGRTLARTGAVPGLGADLTSTPFLPNVSSCAARAGKP